MPLIALIGAMILISVLVWSAVPGPVPVHWNFGGEVDRYGNKVEGLLAVPFIALGVYLLFLLFPSIDPRRENYGQFRGPYLVLRATIIGLLALVHLLVLLAAFGVEIDIATVVPAVLGLVFVVIGNLLGKIRPNWFVGIRTPWTLSSRRSWIRTHRLGGWLFVATGFIMVAAAFAGAPFIAVVPVLIAGGVLVLCVYSYLVWRGDPDADTSRR